MSEIGIKSVVVTIDGVDIDVSNVYDTEKGAWQQFEAQAIAIKALAEENAKLRAALKRFISYGNNFAYRLSDGNPYLQAIEALGENE